MDKDLERTCSWYDAIIGTPTLHDGDAVISIRDRKVYFHAWDTAFDCTIPEDPPKSPKRHRRHNRRSKPQLNGIVAQKDDTGSAVISKLDDGDSISSKIATLAKGPQKVRKDGDSDYYHELLLKEFNDILVDQLPNELPPLRDINHHIPYKPTKPWIAHKFRLPEAQKQALEKDMEPKLRSGIYRYTSEIPLAASHMVPKHDSKLRHVQDLRKRNEDTERMAWPMPDQEELVHNIARSSNGSVFDMISAFDQTRIDPKDEKYATIINHMGVFQQRTIQQDDKNAVATQQRTMQHTLRDDWGRHVTVYVDDGTIYDDKPGRSPYEHYLVYHRILMTLRNNKFYLSRKKTRFFVDMVNEGMDVLGRHVQNGEISIAKPKVEAFIALRSPTSFQELGKDLGMYNWLTEHLPWAAEIAVPL